MEVLVTTGTAMLRKGDNQVPWTVSRQVAQIMQGASEDLVPIRRMPAPRAFAFLEAAPSVDDFGFGQILDTRDSFADISRILAGSSHRDHLPEDSVPPRDSSAHGMEIHELIPVMVLQCLFMGLLY
jgi:hypothetical protein